MKIIHVDMDAFYASVEQRDKPELLSKPVVVGGTPDSRGVVCSASYEARKFGVRSAMSCAKAHRLCPQAVFVYPNMAKYRQVSHRIQQIFLDITPVVEPLSLDEAYLDVTENALQEPLARKVAQHIKDRIKTETGLTASAGVGPNKFIAKLASDYNKPNGLVVVPPEKVAAFVDKLPVERFWGVGPKTAERLKKHGLFTAQDLRGRTPQALENLFGSMGPYLFELAHGRDDRRVESERETKSIGSETTFDEDLLDIHELRKQITDQAHEVAAELQGIDRPARTITLKIKYSDFKSITRSRTLPMRTDRAEMIERVAHQLLTENTDAGRRPVRLVGVSVSSLFDPTAPEQLWLNFMGV